LVQAHIIDLAQAHLTDLAQAHWLMLNSTNLAETDGTDLADAHSTNLAETDATDLAHDHSAVLWLISLSSGSFKDLTHFTVIDLESFFFVFICLHLIAEWFHCLEFFHLLQIKELELSLMVSESWIRKTSDWMKDGERSLISSCYDEVFKSHHLWSHSHAVGGSAQLSWSFCKSKFRHTSSLAQTKCDLERFSVYLSVWLNYFRASTVVVCRIPGLISSMLGSSVANKILAEDPECW
jgi:hypothetical protein